MIGFDKYVNLNDKSKFKIWICTIGINLAKKHGPKQWKLNHRGKRVASLTGSGKIYGE